MNAYSELWGKLAVKAYRERFVSAQAKRAIPAQIRALIERAGITQGELAERAGITQGVISRAANPNYGNLTLNTIIRIAAGLDVAFVGQFVPFSELARWFLAFSDERLGSIPTFEQENDKIASIDREQSPVESTAQEEAMTSKDNR